MRYYGHYKVLWFVSVEDIYCHNLRQNCVVCFNSLIDTIRGCNMNCLKVRGRVGGSSYVTKFTILSQIRLWSECYEDRADVL